MSPVDVAVVLSGGGAKAAAHVGALRALEEWGLRAERYVATSLGAVVAAAFASGLEYDEVLRRLLLVERRDVAWPSTTLLSGPWATSLFDGRRLRRTIGKLVPARSFEDLVTPLTFTATDLDSGALQLFGEGGRADVPLLDALTASCSLPLYYRPVGIDGRRYADGGLHAVLPLDIAARFKPELMFAVQVGPSFAATRPRRRTLTPPLMQAHNHALHTLMAVQINATISRWLNGPIPLVLVEPPMEREATFRVDDVVGFVEAGYRAAYRSLMGR